MLACANSLIQHALMRHTSRLPSERKFEVNAFGLLQNGKDAGKVCHGRATFGAEHAHQTFSGNVRPLFKVLKSNGRIDVVAQNGLAGIEIAVKNALDGLAQKRMAKIRIALRAPGSFL